MCAPCSSVRVNHRANYVTRLCFIEQGIRTSLRLCPKAATIPRLKSMAKLLCYNTSPSLIPVLEALCQKQFNLTSPFQPLARLPPVKPPLRRRISKVNSPCCTFTQKTIPPAAPPKGKTLEIAIRNLKH